MSGLGYLPPYYIAFGSNYNCTLDVCSVETSIYTYRPNRAADGCFVAFFTIAGLLHTWQAWKYNTWKYGIAIITGCLLEVMGYAGRIWMWYNPFTYNGFLLQYITITVAPVFMSGAIYVTLSRTIRYLGVEYARFPPIWISGVFIGSDILSLILQGVGGGLSADTTGDSTSSSGVSIEQAGLGLQVGTLGIFIFVAADYFWRWHRYCQDRFLANKTFRIFAGFTTAAIILILMRCSYRIEELMDGYGGDTFHNEGLYIAFEPCLVAAAVFCLNIGHPGMVFAQEPEMIEKKLSLATSRASGESTDSRGEA